VRQVIAASKREHWSDAVNWLFYTVIYGAFPFWGLAVLLWLNQRTVVLEQLFGNAQLAAYAAGLVAASIPVMQKEKKDSPFKHPKWFIGVSMLVTSVAALMLGNTANSSSTIQLSASRMLELSLLLTAVAVLLGFFTELVGNVRDDPDIRNMRDKDVDALARALKSRMEGRDA
jgi:hypothetical protein